MPEDMGLFEAIYTTRAIRKFRSDPIPSALLRRVLDAATQGPSGRNNQPWRFIVVRDPEQKRKVARIYEDGFFENRGRAAAENADKDPSAYLALHMDEAPVIVVVCTTVIRRSGLGAVTPFASSYPSVQNLLLAARALGLGGTITTNHMLRYEELMAALGVPEDRQIIALVPLGFPAESHGPKTRMSVEEIAFADTWDEPIVFD